MKRTKVLFILFLILCISILPLGRVNAHSIELDPEKLITFPMMIFNGEGNISISGSQTGYSLYYQAVEISNENYTKIEEIAKNGEAELEKIEEEAEKLKAEYEKLKETYDDADAILNDKIENDADENEIEEAKTACETAKTNYENKVKEYKAKIEEYNSKSIEIDDSIKTLIPGYIENKWVKTANGDFKVDTSEFSGKKAYAIWVKLVCSDGTIYYDEGTYTMGGTKVEETLIESITLSKQTLNLTVGSSYTLVATIKPSDATNKSIIWSSSNEKVAKVENGKVTAVSEGTATITATTEEGKHIATCKVTVTNKNTDSGTNNNTNSGTNNKTDSTIASGKLPNAGSLVYIIPIAILALSIVSVITYKRVKYLNFK